MPIRPLGTIVSWTFVCMLTHVADRTTSAVSHCKSLVSRATVAPGLRNRGLLHMRTRTLALVAVLLCLPAGAQANLCGGGGMPLKGPSLTLNTGGGSSGSAFQFPQASLSLGLPSMSQGGTSTAPSLRLNVGLGGGGSSSGFPPPVSLSWQGLSGGGSPPPTMPRLSLSLSGGSSGSTFKAPSLQLSCVGLCC